MSEPGGADCIFNHVPHENLPFKNETACRSCVALLGCTPRGISWRQADQTAANLEFSSSTSGRAVDRPSQLPGGEYFPRSWLAVCRTLPISSCVQSLMRLTL